MKSVLVLAVLCTALVVGPAMAQQPATPAPATPAAPAAAQAPAPPRPFPEGAKIAYVDLNQVASQSKEGQAAGQRIKEMQAKIQADLDGRQKALQTAQQKLEQGGALLSDSARAQQAKEIERMQVELQRATQDANQDVGEFTQELQLEFQQKLLPVIARVAAAKNLHFIFSIADSGVVYVDPGLNVTNDVVAALDAAAPAPPAQ
jgi:outer membrane protein